ncbi:MAG: hypothetical protein ACKOED_12230 [Aestuariivirga sp.]|uniref:hypothetical protein n=1 Tax=Aestuariivirga sp. TaxID=2650926 RepID=UPI0038D1BBE4
MATSGLSRNSRHAAAGLEPEDFEAIEQAVLETARGRWFLDQYASRLRARETAGLLAGIQRLEAALAANHDALMERLAGALAAAPGTEDEEPFFGGNVAQMLPRHMSYFRDDEALFEPPPRAGVSRLADIAQEMEAEREAARKSRIVIIRHKPGERLDVPLAGDLAEAS